MGRKILAFAFLGSIILSFWGSVYAVVDGIVAVINDEVITQKDINEFAAVRFLQHSQEYKDRKELEEEMQKWRKEAVERIIEERLLVQEAKREKIAVEPEWVERRIGEVKAQFPSTEEFEKNLISDGLTLNDLKRKINEQLLMRKVVEVQVRDKIFVSPSEVTAYYEGHIDQMVEPEQAEVDSIFIPFENSESMAKKQTEEALTALKGGEDFSAVAKKYSYSPAIGKISRGQIKKDIEEVIFKLKKGEHSSSVRTENGFYIFKFIDIIPPRPLAINEVKDKIYRFIFEEKFERQFSKWMATLKANAYIHVK